jgi:hypothetical protein
MNGIFFKMGGINKSIQGLRKAIKKMKNGEK